MTCRRGTSNTNDRGSSEDRRRRREWLVKTYRANLDAVIIYYGSYGHYVVEERPLGDGLPACRCYRCGDLLTVDIVTVDRIKPGVEGGTYRRNNIRPACSDCNTETGLQLLAERRRRA